MKRRSTSRPSRPRRNEAQRVKPLAIACGIARSERGDERGHVLQIRRGAHFADGDRNAAQVRIAQILARDDADERMAHQFRGAELTLRRRAGLRLSFHLTAPCMKTIGRYCGSWPEPGPRSPLKAATLNTQRPLASTNSLTAMKRVRSSPQSPPNGALLATVSSVHAIEIGVDARIAAEHRRETLAADARAPVRRHFLIGLRVHGDAGGERENQRPAALVLHADAQIAGDAAGDVVDRAPGRARHRGLFLRHLHPPARLPGATMVSECGVVLRVVAVVAPQHAPRTARNRSPGLTSKARMRPPQSVRCTTSTLKHSMTSPALMSWNWPKLMPHSWPATTSFTSSLKRFRVVSTPIS